MKYGHNVGQSYTSSRM